VGCDVFFVALRWRSLEALESFPFALAEAFNCSSSSSGVRGAVCLEIRRLRKVRVGAKPTV
jgi:hypothetical protein